MKKWGLGKTVGRTLVLFLLFGAGGCLTTGEVSQGTSGAEGRKENTEMVSVEECSRPALRILFSDPQTASVWQESLPSAFESADDDGACVSLHMVSPGQTVTGNTPEWWPLYAARKRASLPAPFTDDEATADSSFPVSQTVWGFFYNKTLFRQYGFTVPAQWKDFTTLLENIRIRGISPVTAAGADDEGAAAWFYHMTLRLIGPDDFRKLMTGEIRFTDSRVRRVMNYWRPMVLSYFESGSSALGTDEAWQTLLSRQSGVLLASSAALADLSPEERAEIGFFPFPAMPGVSPDSLIVSPGDSLSLTLREGASLSDDNRDILLSWIDEILSEDSFPVPAGQLPLTVTGRVPDDGLTAELSERLQAASSRILYPPESLSPAAQAELARICREFLRRNFTVASQLDQVDLKR